MTTNRTKSFDICQNIDCKRIQQFRNVEWIQRRSEFDWSENSLCWIGFHFSFIRETRVYNHSKMRWRTRTKSFFTKLSLSMSGLFIFINFSCSISAVETFAREKRKTTFLLPSDWMIFFSPFFWFRSSFLDSIPLTTAFGVDKCRFNRSRFTCSQATVHAHFIMYLIALSNARIDEKCSRGESSTDY